MDDTSNSPTPHNPDRMMDDPMFQRGLFYAAVFVLLMMFGC
ncbi:MAG: hypothetical protein PPP56_11375 [Longimonas sp.]